MIYLNFFRTAASVLLILAVFVMTGCAAGPWGSLRQDPEVTEMFRKNRVPEDYRYYLSGRSNLPYAIVGVDPEWRFESRFWQELEPNTSEFERKVRFIWDPDVWYQYNSGKGAWILDPGGGKIGVWYSMYPDTSISVDKEEKSVLVHSPHMRGGSAR
ncbi:MAG: hypothetical protein ACQETG_02865 [Thermodesulfobacteriota bacterium]